MIIAYLGFFVLMAWPVTCLARIVVRNRRARSDRYHDRMRPIISKHTPAGMQVDPKDVGR
jgi:hypothetical protein